MSGKVWQPRDQQFFKKTGKCGVGTRNYVQPPFLNFRKSQPKRSYKKALLKRVYIKFSRHLSKFRNNIAISILENTLGKVLIKQQDTLCNICVSDATLEQSVHLSVESIKFAFTLVLHYYAQ